MPQAMPNLETLNVYQPRNPQACGYYKCVETHFEELEQIWDDQYATRFGFWREYVTRLIHRYLECGDLHFGFARVKCEECGHEYLLAFVLEQSGNPAESGIIGDTSAHRAIKNG